MIHFFSKKEEQQIIDAIREAEENTSGEIRVHLQDNVDGELMQAAVETFYELGMHHTAAANGVLIFMVPKQRQFAIVGDQGINEKVPPGFWDDVRNLMLTHFQKKEFAKGVCEGVRLSGEKLKEYFPVSPDDLNELTNELSFG